MKLIKSKKGIGIPYVIGIVTFVLALTTTLFSVSINQNIMVRKSEQNIEEYTNGVQSLLRATDMIYDNKNLLDSSTNITDLNNFIVYLETQFSIDITHLDTLGYLILNYTLENGNNITNYINYSISSTPSLSDFMNQELEEIAEKNPPVDKKYVEIPPDTYLTASVSFYNTFVTSKEVTETAIDFSNIVNNAKKSQTSHLFAVNPKNATNIPNRTENILIANGSMSLGSIADFRFDQILIVDGNLSISGSFNLLGTVIVNGSVVIAKDAVLSGTIYALDVSTNKALALGTSTDPLFVFTDTFVFENGRDSSNYSLYIFANIIYLSSSGNEITGGFFSPYPIQNSKKSTITIDTVPLSSENLVDYGLPLTIFPENSEDPITESIFKSTFPR